MVKDDKSFPFSVWICIAIAVSAIGLSICWAIGLHREAPNDWTQLGTRGDFYGGIIGIGVAASGTLLFFGAILLQRDELALQRHELQLQREEMGLQRKEMVESRKVAQDQVEALEQQQAEMKQQNDQMQNRDDIQLILSLADRTTHSTPSNAIRWNQPVAEAALRIVIGRFGSSGDGWACKLLGLYVSTCVPAFQFERSAGGQKSPLDFLTQALSRVISEATSRVIEEYKNDSEGIGRETGRLQEFEDQAMGTITSQGSQ